MGLLYLDVSCGALWPLEVFWKFKVKDGVAFLASGLPPPFA